MSDPYQSLRVEDRGPVRLITFDRPEMFNPLDTDSGAELVAVLEDTQRRPEVRAVVLTGAGRAFAAGGNLRLMRQTLDQGRDPAAMFAEITAYLNRSIIALRRLPQPVVAAMNGVAAGGGMGWCLACDLVVMAQSARFEPGYIHIALNPDGGATLLVTRLIGHKRASEFFLRGGVITSEQALAWGMVNQVVPDHQTLETALDLARELARGPAEALATTKALLNQALFPDLEAVLEQERQQILRLCRRPEFAEGVRAFFEKRRPRFA